MKDGFVKVAAVTPDIRVADVAYNTQNICKMIDETVAKVDSLTILLARLSRLCRKDEAQGAEGEV